MVTVRPQQMLLNTRAKRRTAASRQSVLYAWVRPPDCRPRSRYAPLPRRSIARSHPPTSVSVGTASPAAVAVIIAAGPTLSALAFPDRLVVISDGPHLEHVRRPGR